jgi:hypothetical protein
MVFMQFFSWWPQAVLTKIYEKMVLPIGSEKQSIFLKMYGIAGALFPSLCIIKKNSRRSIFPAMQIFEGFGSDFIPQQARRSGAKTSRRTAVGKVL